MKKGLIILGILLIVIAGLYFYAYRSHRDIASENSDFSVSVATLQKEYSENVDLTNKKYLDKTIEVNGKITSIDLTNHFIVVDSKLTAIFNDSILTNVSPQKTIKIKGRFLGYDDLLEEFKMDQVSLSE